MRDAHSPAPLWGLVARFADASAICRACEAVRDAGYTRWDAHTPFPVAGLDRAMGLRLSPLCWIAFFAGLLGAGGGMLLQWWTSAVDYPLVIGAKPLFSWPAFVPVAFEMGLLGAAIGTVIGMLRFCRLPRLHHPLFALPQFDRASDDRFFLTVEASDPQFDSTQTPELLHRTGALDVEPVYD